MRNLLIGLLLSSNLCVGAALAQAPAAPAAAAAAPKMNPDFAARLAAFGTNIQPVEPFRIVGNVYYVGAASQGAYLITTPKGHILIDTGPSFMISSLGPNIINLGFKLEDIKILLPTHAHFDHVQTLAYMKRATGGAVMALEGDVKALETGKDLSALHVEGWEPVQVDRVLKDGDTVQLGGVSITAVWAPGHTPGNATYIMTTQEAGQTYTIAFGGPPTPVVSNPVYDTRPADAFAAFKALRQYPVNMQLTGHPGNQFKGKLDDMRAGTRPHPLLMAPGAWTKMIDDGEAAYKTKLAAAAKP